MYQIRKRTEENMMDLVYRCKLCGEEIIIKADGAGVCGLCGERYSPEGLPKPEKVAAAPAVSQDLSAHRKENVGSAGGVSNLGKSSDLIFLARSAVEEKEYAKAKTYCDQVLMQDHGSLAAWQIKLSASEGAKGHGEATAGVFAQAMASLGDADKKIFCQDAKKVFHRETYFDDNLVQTLVTLAKGDERFVEQYVDYLIRGQVKAIRRSRSSTIGKLREFDRKAVDSGISSYYMLRGQTWNMASGELCKQLRVTKGIYDRLGHLQIIEPIWELCTEAKQFLGQAEEEIPGGRDFDKIRDSIQYIMRGVKGRREEEARKRAEAYWQAHPEEKAALEQEIDEARLALSEKEKRKPAPALAKVSELQREISRVEAELARQGIFAFKKKEELRDRISLLSLERDDVIRQQKKMEIEWEQSCAQLRRNMEILEAKLQSSQD